MCFPCHFVCLALGPKVLAACCGRRGKEDANLQAEHQQRSGQGPHSGNCIIVMIVRDDAS